MGMTTKVKDFMQGVSTILQDISPQYSRWPETELVRYINYGQLSIAKYLPQAGARIDAIKLQPGTRQSISVVAAASIKPGDGSGAAEIHGISLLDVIRNMGDDGLTPGRVVRVSDRYTRDTVDPDWHTRTGTVVREYVYDANTPKSFYVTPGISSASNVWVEISWMAEPVRIPDGGAPGNELYGYDGTSTQLLGVHDVYVEDLQNYVLALAFMKSSKNTENLTRAQAHTQLFTQSINAQAAVITGVSPNLKALPFVEQVAKSEGAA